MPDVIASGPLSRPFALAAELLAASATFQALVSAADATEALDSIDYPYRDLEAGDYLIPGGYLFDDESLDQFRDWSGKEGGQLGLVLSAAKSVTHATDSKNDLKEWRNTLGAILAEMLTLSKTPAAGGGFHWNLTGWRKVSIGWQQKSEDALDADPTVEKTFRIGLFILNWV
ncbi:MAG: hypothetical protein A3E01_10795 [Gammaproteobacteria bacterium RIFCSPHIGHO2_12_FULL_63_22]|nr:MAG: hypothetical protein A3E01_10795 [Gammaproteobacteria bacterium RIFCSPHIGHO2_12_FULL_63_22]